MLYFIQCGCMIESYGRYLPIHTKNMLGNLFMYLLFIETFNIRRHMYGLTVRIYFSYLLIIVK